MASVRYNMDACGRARTLGIGLQNPDRGFGQGLCATSLDTGVTIRFEFLRIRLSFDSISRALALMVRAREILELDSPPDARFDCGYCCCVEAVGP
jgi:hypothetical protein